MKVAKENFFPQSIEVTQDNGIEMTLSSTLQPEFTRRESDFFLRLSKLDEALDPNEMPNDNSSYYSEVSSPKSSTYSFPDTLDPLLDKISEFEL